MLREGNILWKMEGGAGLPSFLSEPGPPGEAPALGLPQVHLQAKRHLGGGSHAKTEVLSYMDYSAGC